MDTVALKRNMDFTYTFLDRVFRKSIGQTADFSCALYDGDYSIPLDVAQRRKHELIGEQLGIGEGTKVIDIGCGWGPMLNYFKETNADATGITLSDGQARACRRNGFKVEVMDFRDITPDTFGQFEAAVCLGVSGHICTVDEWEAGRQDSVYRAFFHRVADLLPTGGRFVMDTLEFNPDMNITYADFDVTAPKDSWRYYLGLMGKQFPGSYLADGAGQFYRNLDPFFKVINRRNGRLDYVETARQWNLRFKKITLDKLLLYTKYVPRYLTDREFRYWLSQIRHNPHRICLEREVMDFHWWVLEKR